MPRRSKYPQSRRHIWVYDIDWDYLTSRFGVESSNPLGTGPAIREIIHQRVKILRQREIEARDQREESSDA